MNPMMTMTKPMTGTFMGQEVNGSKVMATMEGDKLMLSLSNDFKVPGAPAPHWRVLDSMGNAYLLRRLVTADGMFHKMEMVPTYVKDVAKVQIYCAFAEVVLGEAKLA